MFINMIIVSPYSRLLDFNRYVISGVTISDVGVQVSLTYSASTTATVASNTNAVSIGNNVVASIAIQTTMVNK